VFLSVSRSKKIVDLIACEEKKREENAGNCSFSFFLLLLFSFFSLLLSSCGYCSQFLLFRELKTESMVFLSVSRSKKIVFFLL